MQYLCTHKALMMNLCLTYSEVFRWNKMPVVLPTQTLYIDPFGNINAVGQFIDILQRDTNFACIHVKQPLVNATYVPTYARMCVHTYVCTLHMYLCMYVCTYIRTYNSYVPLEVSEFRRKYFPLFLKNIYIYKTFTSHIKSINFIPGPNSTDSGLPVLKTGSPIVTPAVDNNIIMVTHCEISEAPNLYPQSAPMVGFFYTPSCALQMLHLLTYMSLHKLEQQPVLLPA